MKRFRKKDLAILTAIAAVIFLLLGVFLYVFQMYRSQGLALAYQWEGKYSYNGKLFLSEDGTTAKFYSPLGREGFSTLPRKTLALDEYGFEGEEYSYFEMEYRVNDPYRSDLVRTHAVNVAEGYEGFWPVSSPERFVYLASDGAKYLIHPTEKLCYPMFTGSVEGVDVYGRDVVAFSADGSWAVGIAENQITIYHTDPMDDSLRIVDTKTVTAAGKVQFGAFVGNSQAYFSCQTASGQVYYALNCPDGAVAPAGLSADGKFSDPVSYLFVQREDGEEGEITWCHLLLGKEKSASLPENCTAPRLFAVSPEGGYAVFLAAVPEGEEYFVASEDRVFSLSSVLEEGEVLREVVFSYENMVTVLLEKADGTCSCKTYKVCFS